MGKGSVQRKAVEMEGRLALDLAAVLLHTEVGACWSVHWENHVLVGTTVFVELLQGGSVCFCTGVGRTSSLWETRAHAGTGVIMHPS